MDDIDPEIQNYENIDVCDGSKRTELCKDDHVKIVTGSNIFVRSYSTGKHNFFTLPVPITDGEKKLS